MENTSTDWKALCIELAKVLAEEYGVQREFDGGGPLLGSGAIELLSRARTALSQPEPEGPTDEELEEFALKHGGGYFNCDCQAEADILTRKHVSNYRAVLARWGRATVEPPAKPVHNTAQQDSQLQ